MEQPSEQKGSAPEVKVLIIGHRKNFFTQPVQFLARRGVPCSIKTNIRDGIQYITKEKPTCVFLSWNLPNANTVKTFQLITQALKTDCIVFAEKSDGKTAAELNNSRLTEVMHAPISGPGFFMRLQKLLKSKEEAKNPTVKTEKTSFLSQNTSTSVRIRIKSAKDIPKDGEWHQTGVDSETNEPIYTFRSSYDQIFNNKKGTFTFKGLKPPQLKNDGTWDTDNGHFSFEEDITSNGIINFQNGAKSNTDDCEEDSDPSLNNIDDLFNSMNLSESTEDNSSTQSSKKDLENAESDKSSSKNFGSVVNFAKPNEAKNSDISQSAKDSNSVAISATNHKQSLHETMIVEPIVKKNGPGSILLDQTLKALKASVRPAKVNHALVENVSKAKILNINSDHLKGYLICVIPMFYEIHSSVLNKLKENLMMFLKEHGENLEAFEELNVDLVQTNFKNWCDQNADFTLSMLDDEQEMILAFTTYNPTLPNVEENNGNMASVKTKDLEANTKTKCDLFIHLPRNNKFIRYLKSGDQITQNHTEKFEKHKVKDLHIKKDDVHSFHEYFASNQIRKQSAKKTVAQ